jgi:hypothetical protein
MLYPASVKACQACVSSAPQKPTGIPSVEDVDGFAITIRIFFGLSGLVTLISPLIGLLNGLDVHESGQAFVLENRDLFAAAKLARPGERVERERRQLGKELEVALVG